MMLGVVVELTQVHDFRPAGAFATGAPTRRRPPRAGDERRRVLSAVGPARPPGAGQAHSEKPEPCAARPEAGRGARGACASRISVPAEGVSSSRPPHLASSATRWRPQAVGDHPVAGGIRVDAVGWFRRGSAATPSRRKGTSGDLVRRATAGNTPRTRACTPRRSSAAAHARRAERARRRPAGARRSPSRLRACAVGRSPRRPSLAPSATMTISGRSAQHPVDAAKSAGRRVAAHAGVHHAVGEALAPEPRSSQRRIRLVGARRPAPRSGCRRARR